MSLTITRNPDASEPPTEAEAGSSVELIAGAGPIEMVRLYATPSTRGNGTVRLGVSPEDRYGNTGRFAKAVDATLSWDGGEQLVALQAGVVLSLPATSWSRGCSQFGPMVNDQLRVAGWAG